MPTLDNALTKYSAIRYADMHRDICNKEASSGEAACAAAIANKHSDIIKQAVCQRGQKIENVDCMLFIKYQAEVDGR